ncbi:MAG: FAD-binding oxidoreductase [Chloroflexi bacterium]|nr:FAD-binding oxidoreductase [Chloroflexota bacterium]
MSSLELPIWDAIAPGDPAAVGVDGVVPRYHARPASPEGVATLLRACAERGLAVLPRGGGTRLGIGNPLRSLDLVLDTGALDAVVEYESADLTITVQAGMPLARLQAVLAEQGQMLPLDPPAETASTVGGVVAANASGPLRYAFGTARDLVLGTRVANTDGTITRAGGKVVKNVAGYDLNKLHVGGLGCLGVLTELSFKLQPLPASTRTLALRFDTVAAQAAFLAAVVRSNLGPLAIEALGPTASGAAGLGERRHVVLRLGGYPHAVERQASDLPKLATNHGGHLVENADGLWDRVRNLQVQPAANLLVKAGVPISATSATMEQLQERLADFAPRVWGHAGNGVVYASASADDERTETLAELLAQLRQELRGVDTSASLVLLKAPLALKRHIDVWGDAGDGLPLMRSVKAALDPTSTLNPGRFVGGI